MPRTEVMKNIGKYISQEELNRISGVAFAFNTIYKLVWLRKTTRTSGKSPCVALHLQPAGLQAHRHHGDRPTMAGTSQLTDLETGDFPTILNCLGLSRGLFIVDAGEPLASLRRKRQTR
ncbi:MAG: hypothetical protein ACLSUW_01815 [Akkermansia sp.]